MVGIEDPDSIVETIKKIQILNETTRTEILDRAEKMVKETYNWEVVAKDMEKMFNELVANT